MVIIIKDIFRGKLRVMGHHMRPGLTKPHTYAILSLPLEPYIQYSICLIQ